MRAIIYHIIYTDISDVYIAEQYPYSHIAGLLESGTDGFEVTLHKASAACREIGAKNNRVRQDGLCNYLILTIFGENTQP